MISARLFCCFALGAILSAGLAAATLLDPEPTCQGIELPQAAKTALKRLPDLTLSCRLNPSVIKGDFDGDGRLDYAVLVTQKSSKKRGFLIAFASGRSVVAGAGTLVSYGTTAYADLNFDHWELHRKSQPVESAEDQEPLSLHADALLVSYHETASGLFYWDGKKIRWYQQGD